MTALSAGHRACFSCRHKQARAFLGGEKVGTFDALLHPKGGLAPIKAKLLRAAWWRLMARAYALRGRKLLCWSPSGYDAIVDLPEHSHFKVLTPPLITAILARGYQPRWHETAQHWDTT